MTKKIDIKEVITEKDYFAFVKFPFSLYKIIHIGFLH